MEELCREKENNTKERQQVVKKKRHAKRYSRFYVDFKPEKEKEIYNDVYQITCVFNVFFSRLVY